MGNMIHTALLAVERGYQLGLERKMNRKSVIG